MKLLILLTSLFSALLSLPVYSGGMSCQTSHCHQGITDNEFKHAPLKTKTSGCTVCHQVLKFEGRHPLLKEQSTKEKNETCLLCHVDFKKELMSHSSIHSAIEQNGCTSCHTPHGGPLKKLLKEQPKFDLCLKCHQTYGKFNELHSKHNISKMQNGCLSCHNAHASQFPKITKKPIAQMCLECHESPVVGVPSTKKWSQLPKEKWHTPVAQGECLKCHNQHGSNHKNLLVDSFSSQSYTEGMEEQMGLCFKCHKVEVMKAPIVKNETGFRNGSENLHYLHLYKSKNARSCALCHSVHASEQPKLINTEFQYIERSVPIQYAKKENGGTCATACHKTYEYKRDQAYLNEKD